MESRMTLTFSAWCCNVPILKNDGVRQWEGWHPIYEMEKKNMVETTNQFCFSQQLLEGANCLEAWTL